LTQFYNASPYPPPYLRRKLVSMKRFLLFGLLGLAACEQQSVMEIAMTSSRSFNTEVEKEAILDVIENETTAFFNRDYESWQQFFVQEDYAFQAWTNADGSFSASVGWSAIDKLTGQYIKTHPVPPGYSYYPRVERRNMVIKFYSDKLAYLVWDQYNSDQENKFFRHSKDQRIMEKVNGQWKIANVSAYYDYKSKIPVDSLK
jgi:hypothetical protein